MFSVSQIISMHHWTKKNKTITEIFLILIAKKRSKNHRKMSANPQIQAMTFLLSFINDECGN
jgi:hypothetical protein